MNFAAENEDSFLCLKGLLQNLDEIHELQSGEDLTKSVDLLLCDAPYNLHCQQDHENTDHDLSNANGMKAVCDFAENFLSVEDKDTFFVPPYNFPSNSGVLALAKKR